MCLYGCPDETWELKEPPDVPHELPEPNIGINFARDGMPEKEWLAHIAIHSDAWLYSYAFYIAIRAGLDAETRQQLFNMINSSPTIYEIVSETCSRVRVLGWPLPSIEEEEDVEDVEDEAEQMAAAANHSSITSLPSRLPLLFPSSNSRAPSLAFSSSAVVAVAAADYLNLSDDELMAA
ncbi:PHD finger protein ALFIN-LIKE 6-like [Musa acuminata AAA Group]|uniref:PHD finger protein ALFIN-LIKE 6-like n=1 Tax=Musa acuminata AAA Group TaxID=214697 RepID=UPI0031DC089E